MTAGDALMWPKSVKLGGNCVGNWPAKSISSSGAKKKIGSKTQQTMLQ